MINLSNCSKNLYRICSSSKRFLKAKKISHDLINKGKYNDLFLASFLDEYFVGLKDEFGYDIRPYVFLSIRCLISDLIYCHLFHRKRGFNVVNRCQYCTRFAVDSTRLSCIIQKEFCFKKKTDFDPDIVKNLLSESFYLNVHYTSVASSVHNDCQIFNVTNFGVVYYDSVCSPISLYLVYLEIRYIRFLVNLMRKKS